MVRLLLGSITIGILYGVFNFFLIPFLSDQFDSTAIAGNLVSIGMFITVFTGMFFGYFGDKNQKHLAYTKLLFLVALIMLFAFCFPNTVLLYVVSILFVTSMFSILTPFSALVSRASKPEARDKNYGWIMGSVNISMFVSSLFVGLLMGIRVELVFIVFSIAALVFVAPLLLLRKERTQNQPDIHVEVQQRPFALTRTILFVLLSQFGIWFSVGGILPYLTSFISSGFSVSIGVASMVMGLSTLLSGLISSMAGVCSKKFGRKNLYILSLSILISVFLLLSLFFAPLMESGLVFPVLFLILFSIALGFVYAFNVSIVSSVAAANHQGKIFGLNNIVLVVSQSISLSLFGLVINFSGYQPAFLLVMGGFLMALVFYVMHIKTLEPLRVPIKQKV